VTPSSPGPVRRHIPASDRPHTSKSPAPEAPAPEAGAPESGAPEAGAPEAAPATSAELRPGYLARLAGTLGRILVVGVPLAVLGVFFVLPVTGMVSRGLWIDGAFDATGILDLLARPRVHRVVWFTVWSATAGTLLSVGLGLPAAYVCYRLDFPGRRLIRTVLMVPFVLPTVVVGVAFRQLLSGPLSFLDADGSAWTIVAALAFFNIAVVVRVVGSSWENLDPRPGEAAAALGATPAQVFRTATWPLLRPAILAAASVVFLFCATAFGVVLMLGGLRYSTVETEIYLLTTNLLDLRAAAGLSLLQLVVVTALLVLVRRLDLTPRAVAHRVPARPLGRSAGPSRAQWPALLLTGVCLVLVITPMLTLLIGSFRSAGTWTVGNYVALADGSSSGASVAEALLNSLRIAVDATWMSLTLGLAVVVVVTRRARSRLERGALAVVDGLFALPLGVSAVTLGFGFLITLDRPPLDLRDSPWLVPIAQALVALPLVVRTLTPVVLSMDYRQHQAAASLGAGSWQTVRVVDWPLIRRPLAAAMGLAFAVSLGEFGATSFLVRDDRLTLPVMIYRLLAEPGAENYGAALAASVVLAVVTATVIVAVDRLETPSMMAAHR
jgi:thiamine transport system permease protein